APSLTCSASISPSPIPCACISIATCTSQAECLRLRSLLQLEFDSDQRLTGRVLPPIVNGHVKRDLLQLLAQQEDLPRHRLVAMGDGANDRWMIEHAGLGVAYHAKPILKQATPHHINYTGLDTLLHFLPLDLRGRDLPSPSLAVLRADKAGTPPRQFVAL